MNNLTYYSNYAIHYLGSFSVSDLDGSFEEAVKRLNVVFDWYKKYIESPQTITEYLYGDKGAYIDGTNCKTIKFDKLTIRASYDGDMGFIVEGIRGLLPEEDAVLKGAKSKTEEQEKEQLKMLLKKHPGIS